MTPRTVCSPKAVQIRREYMNGVTLVQLTKRYPWSEDTLRRVLSGQHPNEPTEMGSHGFFAYGACVCCLYANGKPTVGDFTPPPCDDWRQSKRRIGGEK